MPQAVLFINGERIRQRGLHAPKKNRGINSWIKDLNKVFDKELGDLEVRPENLVNSSIEADQIRLYFSGEVGILVNRAASWAA